MRERPKDETGAIPFGIARNEDYDQMTMTTQDDLTGSQPGDGLDPAENAGSPENGAQGLTGGTAQWESDPEPETPESAEGTEPDDDDGKPRTEQKLRKRAQTAEQALEQAQAERDDALTEAETVKTQLAEYLAEREHGIKPQALWAAGATLADLLGDDSGVDPDAVAEAVAQARESLGLRRGMAPNPAQGRSATESVSNGPSWSDALRR